MSSLLIFISAGHHHIFHILEGILYGIFSLNCWVRAIFTITSKKRIHVCPLCSLMSQGITHSVYCCFSLLLTTLVSVAWTGLDNCITAGIVIVVLSITLLSASLVYTQAANIPAVGLSRSVSISHRYVISTWIIIFITPSATELFIWIHSEFLSPQTSPLWMKTRDQQVLFLLFGRCMWFHYIETKVLLFPVFLNLHADGWCAFTKQGPGVFHFWYTNCCMWAFRLKNSLNCCLSFPTAR